MQGAGWGVIPGGGCGPPPNFWQTTLFSGFSHATDRKVPSEVVLMGSFMSVNGIVLFLVKKSVEL